MNGASQAHAPAGSCARSPAPGRPFGMVHAIGAKADVAGPVTKLHRRTTPVPLRVSKIPSWRPSCPRAGRRTGTYGYLVSNKHGMGPQPRSLRACARVNVGSRGSLSLGACSSAERDLAGWAELRAWQDDDRLGAS